jgi:glutamate-5-semialdehyde dehydrogenase
MDLDQYCNDLGRQAREASRKLATAIGRNKNRWLELAANALESRAAEIQEANAKDLAEAPRYGLAPAAIDRLTLTPTRIKSAAQGLREIVALPDPIGRVLSSVVRPNGLRIDKVGVPLGVVFFIYESRPNVTVDAAGLCVKSGNSIILRGGKEAIHSNLCLHRILQHCLAQAELPPHAVQLVSTTDREAVGKLLHLDRFIDLAIPRGGESLIRRVAEEATMPVLKHYMGNCHVYVDQHANLDMALKILINSKTHRTGVCNAAESLLVHQAIAKAFLPRAGDALGAKGVEIRGCPTTRSLIPQAKAATEEDYAAEFLDLILSCKVVADVEEAIDHITKYGSQHTEAVITDHLPTAQRFQAAVDSSAVMVNASTRFNDGFEFGLGGEIGISTDKFHARGPCGLESLCSYKYLVHGQGQIRE